MTSASDLFTLQEIDLRRDTRRALIADLESRLGETDELLAARELAATTQATADQLRQQQHAMEETTTDLAAKIKALDEKLYGGSVRNPKELSDLQMEVESLKARQNKLEEESMALIEEAEAADAALTQARKELQRIESEWEEDQEDLLAAKQHAEAEDKQLEAQRQAHAQHMDASSLGLYEQLRRTKQGRGVARVERGTCQGCRVQLPTHLVQRLRSGGHLVQCPSCERILVAG